MKFLLFAGTGVVILYVVYRSQNAAFQEDCALRGVPAGDCSLIRKVADDFREVNYLWVLLAIGAFMISNYSRAARWMMMLRPLGYRPRPVNAYLSIALAYFANLGLPRLGEVVRVGTLAQYEHIPVEKVAGTIVLDRILDVISILIVTGLAVLLELDTIAMFVEKHVNLSERFGNGALLAVALVFFAVLAILFLAFRRRLIRSRLYGKVLDLAKGFGDGLLSIRRIDQPWWFLFHSINIWVMYFFMTYLCFSAFAPTAHLAPVVGLVVFVFGGWGVVIPSPGGMGTYHFLVQTALQMYGISGDDAFSWANISFFSVQLGCNVGLGILSLILLPALNRTYHPKSPAFAEAPADGERPGTLEI